MKHIKAQIIFGIILVVLSAALYFVHFIAFHDVHHILIYLVGDIAFVPMEVLLVTLIIHNLLAIREKKSMLSKMNMIIGAFFSEAGTLLAEKLFELDTKAEQIRSQLVIENDWDDERFNRAMKVLKKHDYHLELDNADLAELRTFLLSKRGFLMRLLENPNLLEHDGFTDLLWAIFHLTEELVQRVELSELPQSDIAHLTNDMKRAYKAIISEWIDYMKHLKADYPYLFSLAMRTNPFNPNASIYVS